jgi:hypothetical protein
LAPPIYNLVALISRQVAAVCAPKGHTAGFGFRFGKNVGHSHPLRHHLGGRDYIPLLVPFPLEKHDRCVIKNVNLFFHHPSFNKFIPFFSFCNAFLRTFDPVNPLEIVALWHCGM